MLLIIVVLIVLLGWYIVQRRPRRPVNFPPGPPTTFMVGNLPDLWKASIKGKFRDSVCLLRQAYDKNIIGLIGPFGNPIVYVFGVDLIKEACSKAECSGRPSICAILYRCFMKNQGLIFSYGASWKEHRRFAIQHLKELGFGKNSMGDVIEAEYFSLRNKLNQDEHKHVKVNKLFNTVVLNVIWMMVASGRFQVDSPQASHLHYLIDEFVKSFGPQSKMFLLPSLRHVAPEWSGFNGIKQHRDGFAGMIRKVIQEHRQVLDRNCPRDFVDFFLLEMEQPGAKELGYTEENLCVIVMDLFLAGSESTATTLEWALLYMSLHPSVQEHVRREIINVTADERRVKYEDRIKMPFTEATIMEIQRMASTVPQTGPHCTSFGPATLGGYHLPKGTIILLHLEQLHHDIEHWGDPEVFRPQRFLDEGRVIKDTHLMPFSAGKRSCLGEQMARMELFLFFCNILQDFRLVLPNNVTTPSMRGLREVVVHPEPFSIIFEPCHH